MTGDDFVTAYAPASIGNVAVGFDMLGLAIEGAGDRVSARKTDGNEVSIREVLDPDGKIHPFLETNAKSNTASIAAQAFWHAVGDGSGVELIVYKGVPLESGMGSSAASAVAGVVAVNALLKGPLDFADLLPFIIEGEKFASGGVHADNVAPSLFGGLILCPTVLLPEVVRLPVPDGLCSVLVYPELQVNTAESRKGLAQSYSMKQWLSQQGYLAGFIAACGSNDIELLGRCFRDVIIEPQRTALVPCFADVRDAALDAGSLGCSLAGSGPSIFAICEDSKKEDVATAMEQGCIKRSYECQVFTSPLAARGAFVEGST